MTAFFVNLLEFIVLILVYMSGPVAVLSAIAWVTRRTQKKAWVHTTVIVAILSWGL